MSHPKNTPEEIYKVQVPLMSNDPNRPAMCYNKKRNHQVLIPVEKPLLELLDGEPKIYVYAHIKDGNFNINRVAPPQSW